MEDKKWEKLEGDLERHIREFVDEHPLYRGLETVEKRNMASCAASAAIGALTKDAIADVDARMKI